MKREMKWRLLALCMAAMLGIAGCSSPSQATQAQTQAAETEAETTVQETGETEGVTIKDGTYTGEAEGYHGTITVEAVVEN